MSIMIEVHGESNAKDLEQLAFGFDSDYRCKRVVKATDEIHAIRRYFKWYYRHYKETSEHQTFHPEPCSRVWAHIAVEDSKGYKHFYR